jgi:hypothetical protein
VVSLPSLAAVEAKLRNSLVNLLDLSSMFYALRLSQRCKKYFNFYFGDSILTHARYSSSPFYSRQAMDCRFTRHILQTFLKNNKISDIDFPNKDYSHFTTIFVDDVALSTFKVLPEGYKASFGMLGGCILRTPPGGMEIKFEKKLNFKESVCIPGSKLEF